MNGTLTGHAPHPGTVLADILEPLHLSPSEFAHGASLSALLVHDIVAGRRGIDTDVASRLAERLGPSPEYWLTLQNNYDGKRAG